MVELANSRPLNVTASDAGVTLKYIAFGSVDETEIYALSLATSPVLFDGLIRQAIDQQPQGGGVWYVDVKYGAIDPGGPAGSEPAGGSGDPGTSNQAPADTDALGAGYSFDLTGQTIHITQSRATTNSVAAVGVASDYKKAIGVTKDRVEGCDIFAGKFEWQRTVQRNRVTLPYLRTLKNLVGSTNNAAFYGFEADAVLYTGASGQYAGDGTTTRWSITHHFAAGENEADVDVGNGIFIDKKAWEYLWVAYEEKDVGGGLVLQVPAAAYTEQVYPSKNFALIEIG